MSEQFTKIIELLKSAEAQDVNLFFIKRKRNQSTKVSDYSILSGLIHEDIGGEFLEIGKNQMISITKNNFKIAKYQENDDICYFDCPIIETIPQNDVPNLDNILIGTGRANESINPKNFAGCWGYIVKIYSEYNTLFLFKKYSQKKKLSQGFLAALVSSGTFTRIDNSLFFIDTSFDAAILLENTSLSTQSEDDESPEVLIFDRNNFEKLFDFYDCYKKYVANNSQDLSSVIDDTGPLLECCYGDARKLKKIVNVIKNNSFSYLNAENIQEICNNYGLNITLNSDGKIVFENDKAWSIIRVLNDDCLKSETSDNRYISQAKVKQGTH